MVIDYPKQVIININNIEGVKESHEKEKKNNIDEESNFSNLFQPNVPPLMGISKEILPWLANINLLFHTICSEGKTHWTQGCTRQGSEAFMLEGREDHLPKNRGFTFSTSIKMSRLQNLTNAYIDAGIIQKKEPQPK